MYFVSFLFSKLQIYSLQVASGFEVKHNYGLFMGNSNPQNVTFKEKKLQLVREPGVLLQS